VRDPRNRVPEHLRCQRCDAHSMYLYYNNGKERSQVLCKLCNSVTPISQRYRKPATYWCPYCGHPLYLWKERSHCSLYKCDWDGCPCYKTNKNKLNKAERLLFLTKSSQFKLRYNYTECHFIQEHLVPSAPEKKESGDIFAIRNTLHTLCLALTFHVSLGLSARKTAFVLRNIFGLPASYQTVLNYSEMAAYHCHKFNLAYKGEADPLQSGDEAYTKVAGENWFTFLFLSPSRRKITSYHCAPNRDELAATIALREAIRTVPENTPNVTAISDGLPSYVAAVHYLNRQEDAGLTHKRVIGLQNLDTESTIYRAFKQMIERLNRTFRFHTNPACGFKEPNGLISLATLFVTHYNFLRPHEFLDYEVPCPLSELKGIATLQGKWAKVLRMATALA
jgi:putative transposase